VKLCSMTDDSRPGVTVKMMRLGKEDA